MATEIRSAPVSDFRGEQLALTTTLAALGVPPKRDTIQCRGVMLRSTADFRLHINPTIKAFLKTADTGATYTDYTDEVTDRDTATSATLSSLATLANGGFLAIAADRQFGGVAFDLDSKNVNASVLTGQYWTGAAWASLTLTDGTISPAGTCLGQDGNITWTLPSDWAPTTLNGVAGYWVRLKVSAALSAAVTLAEAALLNRDASRAYCYAHVLYLVPLGAEDGAIEAILSASTATLDVSWCFGATLPVLGPDQALLGAGLPAALAAGGGLKVEGVAGGVEQPVSGTMTATQGTAAAAGSGWTAKDDGPSRAGTLTVTTSADLSAAAAAIGPDPSAGQKSVLRELHISVDTAMSVSVTEETSATLFARRYLPANGSIALVFRHPRKLATADKQFMAQSSVAGNICIETITTSEA